MWGSRLKYSFLKKDYAETMKEPEMSRKTCKKPCKSSMASGHEIFPLGLSELLNKAMERKDREKAVREQ